MSQIFKTIQAQIIDFSQITNNEEKIIDMITEKGIPALCITNKSIYKISLGQGIIEGTNEIYDTYNQITKEFDFSITHPIFKNSYGIVNKRSEQELKILVYNIMLELTSMSKINVYIEDQWSKIYKDVYQNIGQYKTSSTILPSLPFLKENVDGFFVECKNTVSYLLTIFKIYYQKTSLIAKNPTCIKCIKDISNKNFNSTNKDELIRIFQDLDKLCSKMRAIRNAINHPENYAENIFLLYDVHWENNKTLCPPLLEYKSKIEKVFYQGQEDIIKYFKHTYSNLLNITGNFLNILIEDIDSKTKKL